MISNRRNILRSLARRNYDPRIIANQQTRQFNVAWFKDGHLLTLLQRLTFGLISSVFLGLGIAALVATEQCLENADAFAVLTLGIGLLFVTIGGMGLRNVFRLHK